MINAQFLVALGFLPEDNPDEFGLHIWDKTDAENDPEHDESHPNHQWLFKLSDQSLWLEAYDADGNTLALTELPSLNRNNLIALISLLSHHVAKADTHYELKQLYKPGAMVLEYQPELTHSVWIDYISEDADTKQQLIDELRAGVKDGRWVGWRLILVEHEVMGNE